MDGKGRSSLHQIIVLAGRPTFGEGLAKRANRRSYGQLTAELNPEFHSSHLEPPTLSFNIQSYQSLIQDQPIESPSLSSSDPSCLRNLFTISADSYSHFCNDCDLHGIA